MPYATQIDIDTIYSTDALFVADRDGDGSVDVAAVDQALASASAEIDGYLAVRETLPLTGTHDILVQFCVDIALYRLAVAGTAMTETHRERYEDAISSLKDFASGKMRLVYPVDPNATDPAVTDPSPSPIVVGGPPREFTRDKMKGL